MSNSPSHSQLHEYKEIWNENLVIYQKSLKAFLQVPLQLEPTNTFMPKSNNKEYYKKLLLFSHFFKDYSQINITKKYIYTHYTMERIRVCMPKNKKII